MCIPFAMYVEQILELIAGIVKCSLTLQLHSQSGSGLTVTFPLSPTHISHMMSLKNCWLYLLEIHRRYTDILHESSIAHCQGWPGRWGRESDHAPREMSLKKITTSFAKAIGKERLEYSILSSYVDAWLQTRPETGHLVLWKTTIRKSINSGPKIPPIKLYHPPPTQPT